MAKMLAHIKDKSEIAKMYWFYWWGSKDISILDLDWLQNLNKFLIKKKGNSLKKKDKEDGKFLFGTWSFFSTTVVIFVIGTEWHDRTNRACLLPLQIASFVSIVLWYLVVCVWKVLASLFYILTKSDLLDLIIVIEDGWILTSSERRRFDRSLRSAVIHHYHSLSTADQPPFDTETASSPGVLLLRSTMKEERKKSKNSSHSRWQMNQSQPTNRITTKLSIIKSFVFNAQKDKIRLFF